MIKRLILACCILAGCVQGADYSHIKVIETVDGDTVLLENGTLVRYIGLDTPETRVRSGDEWVESPAGMANEAKEFNRRLVEGKYVRIEFDAQARDKYNRLLGYVFVDDVFVNEKLLEEGYAVLYTYPPNVKYLDAFTAAQRYARRDARGLWGAYRTIGPDEAAGWIGHIRTVRGQVKNTHQSQKAVYLNFGSDWRTDFTIVIFSNCLEYFRNQGIDPVYFYRGKTVEATARIREYNGPEMIVNSPSEIIVLK